MKRTSKTLRAVMLIVFLVVAFTTLFPLLWMFVSAFKKNADIIALPLRFWPTTWIWDNFETILFAKNYNMSYTLVYTFILAVIDTVLVLALNSITAYGFSRMEFRGKKLLWALVMVTMFIPGISTLVTSYMTVVKLNMVNSIWVLIIPGMASSGMIFYMRQFYLNFPLSLEEAAYVDGSTPLRNFFYIFLPASGPAFVIQGVGCFLGFWNSWMWPAITLSDTKLYPVMLTLQFFKSQQSMKDGVVLAGAVITSLPPIILFLVFQKYIVEGIKMSGLK